MFQIDPMPDQAPPALLAMLAQVAKSSCCWSVCAPA